MSILYFVCCSVLCFLSLWVHSSNAATATATFYSADNNNRVTGTITFTQATSTNLVTVKQQLTLGGYSDAAKTGLSYHIHEAAVSSKNTDGSYDCSKALGHYNPSGLAQPQEDGDLAGRHGNINAGDSAFTAASGGVWSKTYDDSIITLFDAKSFADGKSVVIHMPDGSRWACANIVTGVNASPAVLPSAVSAVLLMAAAMFVL